MTVEELSKELLRVYKQLGEELLKEKPLSQELITGQYLCDNGWDSTDFPDLFQLDDVWLTLEDSEMKIVADDMVKPEETWYKGTVPTISEFETLKKLLEI